MPEDFLFKHSKNAPPSLPPSPLLHTHRVPLSSIYQSKRSFLPSAAAAAGGFGFRSDRRRRLIHRRRSEAPELRRPTHTICENSLARSFLLLGSGMECMMPRSRSFMKGGRGGATLDAPNCWALPASFDDSDLFKNPGGFEFLGSMSFNQTELGRERETTPGGEFGRMGHVRLDPGGFNPQKRREGKRLKLHRPSSIEGGRRPWEKSPHRSPRGCNFKTMQLPSAPERSALRRDNHILAKLPGDESDKAPFLSSIHAKNRLHR